MTKASVVFFRLPFEPETLTIYRVEGAIRIETGKLWNSTDEIVCLNFEDYINSLGNIQGHCVPEVLFDLNVANRMLEGTPASQFKNDNFPWKGLSCLAKHFRDSKIFTAIRAIELGKFGNFDDWIRSLPEGWQLLIFEALDKEFDRVQRELEEKGLLDRFRSVEMYLQYQFSKSGIRGLTINREKTKSTFSTLEKEFFGSVERLEIGHDFPIDLYSWPRSYDDLKRHLSPILQEDLGKKYFWDTLELMQDSFDFVRHLVSVKRNRQDITELLRLIGAVSGSYPINYDIFGTVSGRIQVNRPGIQHLKRTSRDIFSPTPGCVFVYADYSQFEPGIFASISQNNKLIELYNDGDIYQTLAMVIGSGCPRKVAKELFLSFIYGMSRENIKHRIQLNYGSSATNSCDEFFNQFPEISNWKAQVTKDALLSKEVSGPFRYLRKVTHSDSETDVKRWAPNHLIQSTASGVFKESLCGISRIESCRLLIPMHDAILVECPIELEANVRTEIQNHMISSFNDHFGEVRIRVTFSPFNE